MQAVQLRAEGGSQLSLVLAWTRIVARTENVEIVNHHQGGTPTVAGRKGGREGGSVHLF